MTGAYYNDHDPLTAAWLRELIRRGLIAEGDVDERSILDVDPADLAGYVQCHFFAGIGGWSLALRLAGWPDDRPVWTGSPPCQPFSAAGKQLGRDDPRHLAPKFASLVGACRPGVLFGEQVASADVFGKSASGAGKRVAGPPQWAWLDDLQDRLEAARYAIGAVDFPSASVGAPHIRQRTFFGAVRLADAASGGCEPRAGHRGICTEDNGARSAAFLLGPQSAFGGVADPLQPGRPERGPVAGNGSLAGSSGDSGMAHATCSGQPGTGGCGAAQEQRVAELRGTGGLADANGGHPGAEGLQRGREQRQQPQDGGIGGLADTDCGQRGRVADGEGRQSDRATAGWQQGNGEPERGGATGRPHAADGFWDAADWLYCRDGKWRPVEPGTFPLAHGLPARVGRLRGYGNAINPVQAAEFIAAFEAGAERVRLMSGMTNDEGVFG